MKNEDRGKERPSEAFKRLIYREIGEMLHCIDNSTFCPLCGSFLEPIKNNGHSQVYICDNLHIISIDTMQLNT